jgi:hypothetical protein
MLPPRRLVWIPPPPAWLMPVLLAVVLVSLAVRALP